MIKNVESLESIVEQWKAVRFYQAMVRTNTVGAFANGAILTSDFRNACDTLVLIFAYSVLERTLQVLRREGLYSEPPDSRGGFKAMMVASRSTLPWVNFELISHGRDERHKAAHGQKIVPCEDSWRYVDAIEAEFVSWRILTGPVHADYTITVGRAN